MSLSLKADYQGVFGDKRLEKRAEKIASMLMLGKTSSIHGVSSTEADQRGCYRFLSNDKVEEQSLIQATQRRCGQLVKERSVYVIQDTTMFDFSRHKVSLSEAAGVGAVGNHEGLGFLGHVSLVIDRSDGELLGLSDIQLWHRSGPAAGRSNKGYKKLAITNKESGKWIKACEATKALLADAGSITFIEDREGDIFEQFAAIADHRTHLLIRSRDNRNLNNGGKLYETMSQQPVAGRYQFILKKDHRKKQAGTVIEMEVRFAQVEIARPSARQYKHLPESLPLYVVDVRQTGVTSGKAIHWRLLTTWEVSNYEQAIGIIEDYKQRWYIEQFFRLLKQKGFRIEDSQLEDGLAIRKLLVMVMQAALRVLQMLLAYDSQEEQPINTVFSQQEQQCLGSINKKVQTNLWINPHPSDTLQYAVWIIARIAGWKPVNKERPPGPTTLKNGLDKFISIFEGWTLAKDVS